MSDNGHRIELSDMIAGLRSELMEAQQKAADADLKFTVETIEIEAQVTVAFNAEAHGLAKWKFWIFGEAEGGAKVGGGRETVQTVKLTLKPDVASEGDEDDESLGALKIGASEPDDA